MGGQYEQITPIRHGSARKDSFYWERFFVEEAIAPPGITPENAREKFSSAMAKR
jgi:hypothetical protein